MIQLNGFEENIREFSGVYKYSIKSEIHHYNLINRIIGICFSLN